MTKGHSASGFTVQLGIFAKPPKANQVKTRLIPDIGADNATEVYQQCLAHALDISRTSSIKRCCYLTEISEHPLFRGLKIALQHGDTLGDRMYNAFQGMLLENDAAIIIGTDCLDMTREHLQQAAELLADFDIVIQPVIDGGYSLIGCRKADPALFSDVHWSSDKVLSQTLLNAEKAGYRVGQLETLRDIDTLDDLKHYPQFQHLIPAKAASD